ncbi:MAG TPA: ribonuclease Y, partial [Patescibacteria group bacterium]|nr:ribonuclease Y [Patescibacteria group bacterium]
VVDSVAEHHEDKPFSRVESVIVYIADAISGSRPGARYEAYDEYIKRVTSIEDISKSFPGVSDAFAVSAGREVRVIVFPDKIDDAATTKLAHDIAEKIHNDVTYPGSVKVTVLRETRATDVAK